MIAQISLDGRVWGLFYHPGKLHREYHFTEPKTYLQFLCLMLDENGFSHMADQLRKQYP